jgi:SAM-dependent methyltransferase
MGATTERSCWCGHGSLEAYSADYRVCRACGTLVSTAPHSPKLYDQSYWKERQTEHHGLPDLRQRARLDLPERCTHWLRRLLSLRLPPARVLDVGCAHGGYVALLGWAGYQAVGTEMSAEVAHFAKDTFGVTVHTGTIENLSLKPGSFDVVVLNDVIEHLPDPVGTLQHCSTLLSKDGFFVVQTPEYKEHLKYEDLKASNDLFLKHMDHNNDEHLYLFSRRAVGALFGRLGFPEVSFSNPVYAYDMSFVASRLKLEELGEAAVESALEDKPVGRLVQALLDKAFESTDRWWAIQRLEAQNRSEKSDPR